LNTEPTVFAVDDDSATLDSLARLIGAIFPRVETYSSASGFLDSYEPSRPGCLVLDVAMPGMSGLELHEKLIAAGIQLPVIFITGHANVRMAVDAMQAGAVDFIEKPFQEHDLWNSISKAFEIDGKNRLEQMQREEYEERMAALSSGEQKVLELILDGDFNKEIAVKLDLSIRTVEDRRARLMRKLGANSVVELVRMAMPVG
jgi:two-component system, LuxR family, response regulator FixJ